MESNDRWQRPLQIAYWLGLVVAMLLCAVKPIGDPDFWWHLHSGQQMWDQGWLLDPATLKESERLRAGVLRGYWLWQVAAYGLYRWLGFWGILGGKLITMLILLGVVVWRMSRLRIQPGVMMLLCTIGFVLFGKAFYLERPQVFSFLFAALLFGLFDQVRDRGRTSWLLVPLMVVWGNVHGGVVVGCLLLLCFGLGMAWEWRKRRADLIRLLFWVAAGIGASLLQPNSWRLFLVLFNYGSDRTMYSMITEYASTAAVFANREHAIAGLWVVMAVHAFGLVLARKRWLPDLLIFVFLSVFCVLYMRNLGFFVIALLPTTAFYVNQLLVSKNVLRYAAGASLLGVFLFGGMQYAGLKDERVLVARSFPQGVADFLTTQGVRGNMFNDYDWGGYLLWRLDPACRPMVDGRILNVEAFEDYFRIVNAEWLDGSENRKALELFSKYDIEIVVIDHAKISPGMFSLTKYLLAGGAWLPVYSDSQGYVLLRKLEKYLPVEQQFGMSACDLYSDIFDAVSLADHGVPAPGAKSALRAELLMRLQECSQEEPGRSAAGRPGEPWPGGGGCDTLADENSASGADEGGCLPGTAGPRA